MAPLIRTSCATIDLMPTRTIDRRPLLKQLRQRSIFKKHLVPLLRILFILLDPLEQCLRFWVFREAIRKYIPHFRIRALGVDGATADAGVFGPEEGSGCLDHDGHLA